MAEEKLREFLEGAEDWDKRRTTVPGVFIVKLPAYRSYPARLAVEVNPVDASGNPTKKRGLYIKSCNELGTFTEILEKGELSDLLKTVDSINPTGKEGSLEEGDVIEI